MPMHQTHFIYWTIFPGLLPISYKDLWHLSLRHPLSWWPGISLNTSYLYSVSSTLHRDHDTSVAFSNCPITFWSHSILCIPSGRFWKKHSPFSEYTHLCSLAFDPTIVPKACLPRGQSHAIHFLLLILFSHDVCYCIFLGNPLLPWLNWHWEHSIQITSRTHKTCCPRQTSKSLVFLLVLTPRRDS